MSNGKGDKLRKDFSPTKFANNYEDIDWRTTEQKTAEKKKKMTSSRWLATDEFKGYIISDPDGWDRENWEYSFYKEKITKADFEQRLAASTVRFPL